MKIFPFLSFAFAVTNFAAGNEQEQKKHGLKLISAMRKLKSSGLRGSNTNMQAREELERELVTFEHFLSLTTENNAETQADGELPNGTEETTYGNYGGQYGNYGTATEQPNYGSSAYGNYGQYGNYGTTTEQPNYGTSAYGNYGQYGNYGFA